jgi:DNA-binding MarR family transcriptional regulator
MPESRRKLIQQLFETMSHTLRCLKGGRGKLFEKYGLSKSQAFIFFMLAHHKDGMTVKDLAATAHVTSGAITQLLDPMVEHGLLERFEDKADRRVVLVKLTAKAYKELKGYHQAQFEEVVHLFDELSDTQITQLAGLLQKIKVDDTINNCGFYSHHHKTLPKEDL